MNDPDNLGDRFTDMLREHGSTDDTVTQPLPDRLELMMEKQRDTIRELAPKVARNGDPFPLEDHFGHLERRDVQRHIAQNLGFCIEELIEVCQELPGRKPWKDNPTPPDFHAFREEMGDALAFFLEAWVFAGLGAQELFEVFLGIADKNIERAQGQY